MRYCIGIFLIIAFASTIFPQSINLDIREDGVLFKDGEDSVLFYQTTNKAFQGKHKRCNYIHPLYGLDGQILTEDFPADHLHHRGIFWAWHQLYVGDKRIGDGWEIKDFKWEVKHVEELKNKGKEKSIKANVIWKSPLWLDDKGVEMPLVSEYTTITVYPAQKNYRVIDVEISLLAMEPNTRIGGSEDKKGYGGFSARIKLEEGMIFSNSKGTVKPQLLPIKAGGWIDISRPLGHGDETAGIAILCHKKNPGHPNPWILRTKRSMQNAVYPFPGAKGVSLSNIEPTILKYRLIIHNGLKESEISSLYTQYIPNKN